MNTIRRKTTISISARVQLPPPELASPSGPESDCVDELDSLPLPPPPSFNSPEDPPVDSLVDPLVDPESLPPPPPEVFENLLDDFPLPPPPPPMQLLHPLSPSHSDSSVGGSLKPCLKLSGAFGASGPSGPSCPSGLSCASVAPPRVPPKPKKEEHPIDVIYSGSRFSLAGSNATASALPPECGSTALNKSPSKKNRRITFDERLVHSPSANASAQLDPPGTSALPPTLPRRDPLKSSMKQHPAAHPAAHPASLPALGKLNSPGCTVTPPREFLKDLQRVMQKKWQVAQKCKDDTEVTPHEVIHPSPMSCPVPHFPS